MAGRTKRGLPPFMNIEIDDNGEFYYLEGTKSHKLGACLTLRSTEVGPRPQIMLKNGKYLSRFSRDARFFSEFGGDVIADKLEKWCKDKFGRRGYDIGIRELIYLQMSALRNMEGRLGGSLQFEGVLRDLGYMNIVPIYYKEILDMIGKKRDKLSEESKSDLVDGFSKIFFGDGAGDWSEELVKNEHFDKRFVSRKEYDDLNGKKGELDVESDKLRDDKKELQNKLKELQNKLNASKQDVQKLQNVAVWAGVSSVIGWSLLAFKCAKDYFFGNSDVPVNKIAKPVKGTVRRGVGRLS